MRDNNYICRVLLSQGIPPNLLGFKYIVYAGRLFAGNDYSGHVTGLYTDIAEEFNTSPQCVERCIRNALHHGSIEQTNSQFLSMMYYRINQ